jgi:hypothetical protein
MGQMKVSRIFQEVLEKARGQPLLEFDHSPSSFGIWGTMKKSDWGRDIFIFKRTHDQILLIPRRKYVKIDENGVSATYRYD